MKIALCTCRGKNRGFTENLAENFEDVVIFEEMCEESVEDFFDIICCSHPNLRNFGKLQLDLVNLGVREVDKAGLVIEAYEKLLDVELNYFKLKVGASLLIKTDDVELARKLRNVFQPLYILTNNREMIGVGIPIEGEITGVEGKIGNFRVLLDGVNLYTGEKVKEVFVDQLVIPGFNVEKDGLFISETGIFEAVSNLGEIVKAEAVSYNEALCPAYVSGAACDMCDCAHGCLERKEKLDQKSCLGCGRCSSLCPTGALSFSLMPEEVIREMVDVMANYGGDKVLLYVCRRSLGKVYSSENVGEVFPIIVPCANSLSEVEVLYPLLKGFNGVYVLHCDDCPHGSFERVKLAERICEALGVNNLVVRGEFDEKAVEDLVELEPLDEGFKMEGNTKRERLFEIVRRILEIKELRIQRINAKGFGKVKVLESCTLCDTCVTFCFTKALGKEEGKLKFTHGLCIDCRICEELCPEKAISVETVLDLSEFSLEKVVKSDDMISCPRCGKKHISKSEYEKISKVTGQRYSLMFCRECRPVVVFEGIYNEVFGGKQNESKGNS